MAHVAPRRSTASISYQGGVDPGGHGALATAEQVCASSPAGDCPSEGVSLVPPKKFLCHTALKSPCAGVGPFWVLPPAVHEVSSPPHVQLPPLAWSPPAPRFAALSCHSLLAVPNSALFSFSVAGEEEAKSPQHHIRGAEMLRESPAFGRSPPLRSALFGGKCTETGASPDHG